MDAKQLALRCRDLADNRKAADLVVLDVRGTSTVTDYLVIATGTSEPHLRAILDEITTRLREDDGVRPTAVDGGPDQAWVVLDFFDVIVHIMKREVRARYDLEGLWGDAVPVRDKARQNRSRPAARGALSPVSAGSRRKSAPSPRSPAENPPGPEPG